MSSKECANVSQECATQIKITVNGEMYSFQVKNNETLLDILRERLDLSGTKEGCGTGDCGACTVIMNDVAVNSCIVLAVEADGKKVQTIEGLSATGNLHPIQDAFVKAGAVQCGYCTPGMIMSTKALLDHNPKPSEKEIRKALSGNICRCTGYVKIVKAVQIAADTKEGVN